MSLAQSKTANTISSASTLNLTWVSNTTTGNLIVVAISSVTSVTSVTDSQSNTYTMISAGITGRESYLFYATNITGGTTPTVTVHTSSGNGIAVVAREYNGMATASVFDKSSTGTTIASSPASSGSTSATTSAGELLVGWSNAPITGQSWGAGSGYGNLATVNNSANAEIAIEDQTVSATGTYSATFTESANTTYYTGIATFVTSANTALTVLVSDSPTTSESRDLIRNNARDLSLSDTTTTSEALTKYIDTFMHSVSDTTTTSESLLIGISGSTDDSFVVSDSSTTSENATISIQAVAVYAINVSDSTTASESVTVPDLEGVNVHDATVTSESMNLLANNFINTNDATITSEFTKVVIPSSFAINVFDGTATSEVFISSTNGPLNVSDTTTTSEALGYYAELASVNEALRVSSSMNINLADIQLYDENGLPILDENGNPIQVDGLLQGELVATSENVTVIVTTLLIKASDSTTTSEFTNFQIPPFGPSFLLISLSDSTITSELLSFTSINNDPFAPLVYSIKKVANPSFSIKR